jgi:translation initiation factor 2 subunit 2
MNVRRIIYVFLGREGIRKKGYAVCGRYLRQTNTQMETTHVNNYFKENQTAPPMSAEMDYESLLKRARDNLPDNISDHQRFQVPEAEVIYEGKLTIIRNFQEICDILQRRPIHLLGYLLKELGTAGNMEGRRVIFKGRLMEARISDRIKEYTNIYVICSECWRPDTHLEKDGRTVVLKCMACGAHRPVRVHKAMG